VVADVDGDGKPDLLVANYYAIGADDGTVGVLLGNGDGTFRTVVAYDSGGPGAVSVAVADVNGDGKLDLVVADFCDPGCLSGGVGVLLGKGQGLFEQVVFFDLPNAYVNFAAVADVNGDGKPDLLVATSDAALAAVKVLLNNTPFCTTPPIVTLSATPRSLWPPNGTMVPVTVSGTITDTGCAIAGAAYAVTDEYGQVQPSGPVTLGAGGAYSFTVLLQASRLGTDLDGRLYTVSVSASNNAGKTESQVATVTVLHDERR